MVRIDLSFFGGGGTSKETVKTHGAKSDYLNNMDAAMYKFFQPIANKYGGLSMGDVAYGGTNSSTSSSNSGSSSSTVGDTISSSGLTDNDSVSYSSDTSWLDDPDNIMGQGFAQADKTYSSAMQNVNDLLSQSSDYLSKQASTTDEAKALTNQYLAESQGYRDQYANLLANGTDDTVKNYLANVDDTIQQNYTQGASSLLSNAAAKGIVNSTVTNQGLYDLSKTASNAVAAQYADAYNNTLENYLKGSQDAVSAGSTGVSNLLSTASGYGDAYKNALSGIDTNQTAASNAYTTALSPVMSAYQYWRDLNTDYTNEETEDTIVSSGGK